MKSIEQVVGCLNRQLNICDSTLRQGEQAAGVVFSNIEKYRIAQFLDDAGVAQIEAGAPIMGNEEKLAVKHIANMGLNASVMSYNRAEINDINASIEADVDSVRISMCASDEQLMRTPGKGDWEWVEGKLYDSITYAKEHGMYVVCDIADASQADLGSLLDFSKVAMGSGADRICYCDRIGCEEPFALYEKLKVLKQIISNIDLEISAANDFGLATANTMAALKAGVKFANATVMGIGRRAGHASLEEVSLAAKHKYDMNSGIDMTKIRNIAELVSTASGVDIPVMKPLLGKNVFAQEAGVNVNGAIIDEEGEAYSPSEVGAERTLVIGKHSARNTIVAELNSINIELSAEEAEELLGMVRRASVQMRRSISKPELFLLYQDMMSGNNIFDDAPKSDE